MATDDPRTDAPSLVAPRDATAVYGREVTFVWEPVEGAQTYRLQVARTARFDEPVLDEEVGAETAVTVGNQFSTDNQTFFWRILAASEGDWVESESVESFLATTEDEAESEEAILGAEEEPVTALARADRSEEEVETYGFEDRFEEEKRRGAAYEGVAARQIAGITVSIIVVILVAVGVLFGWFEQVRQNSRMSNIARQDSRPLRQDEVETVQQLQQYGIVNEEEGVYHIPIDRAMDLIANEESQQQQQPGQSP